MKRLAINQRTYEELMSHLAESGTKEQGAFCLLHEGKGESGSRLLATKLILPPSGAWEHQGVGSLRPSAQWISAVISKAIQAHSGLLFVHSHPKPAFPVGLSSVDVSSFISLAKTLAPMLEGPFAAAIVHPKGWSGVVWETGKLVPFDKIVSVGRTLCLLDPAPEMQQTKIDSRQRDALGVVHDRLRTLSVAVVGCGGLGSPIAEQLARMGVAEIILVDHDSLDTESNVRRVFGSTTADFHLTVPPPKVDVVGRHLEQLGLGVNIQRVNGDVRTEVVFRTLLDADVVINGTDTHGSRAIINELASTYLLPVIDAGVRVSAKTSNCLCGLFADIRILTPDTPCLWCRNIIDPDVIRAENLPEDERRKLQKEGYVVGGIGETVPSVAALTVLGSGLATFALLALLSEEGKVAPSSYCVDGFLGDSHENKPKEPVVGCRCRQNIGRGDLAAPPFMVEI
jgi:molybdopterin/thiamine biosynthesis adenylyltransferase